MESPRRTASAPTGGSPDHSLPIPEGLRFYIVRPGSKMVPVIPVDQLPYCVDGVSLELNHSQLYREGWKYVGETTESASPFSTQSSSCTEELDYTHSSENSPPLLEDYPASRSDMHSVNNPEKQLPRSDKSPSRRICIPAQPMPKSPFTGIVQAPSTQYSPSRKFLPPDHEVMNSPRDLSPTMALPSPKTEKDTTTERPLTPPARLNHTNEQPKVNKHATTDSRPS